MRIEWSADALADLDRFAVFLQKNHPLLAPVVAEAIIEKIQALSEHPLLGKPLRGREEYRQLVLQVLNGTYVFEYRVDHERVVILRVFHGKEARE
jgi:addiction module RelE/StbE family toxin